MTSHYRAATASHSLERGRAKSQAKPPEVKEGELVAVVTFAIELRLGKRTKEAQRMNVNGNKWRRFHFFRTME